MDRKTLLAFGLIAVVLILTPWYMDLVSPVQAPLPADSSRALTGPRESDVVLSAPEASPQANRDALPVNEKFVSINNGLYTATLSSYNGGSFTSFVLNNFSRYDSALVNLIDGRSKNNMAISFVSLEGENVRLENNWRPISSRRSFSVRSKQESVSFETLYRGYKIIKTYSFYPESYKIALSLTFDRPEKYISRGEYVVSWSGGLAPTEKNIKDEFTYFKGYAYLGDELLEPGAPNEQSSFEKQSGNTRWTAVKTKYFISALIPESPGSGAEVRGKTVNKRPLYDTHLRQAVNSTNKFDLYFGPLEYGRILALGVDLEKTMNLGWTVFRPLGRLVTWSLTKMYGIIPNYGVVVIVFAFLVKILLNPLTKKQFQSTKKMQALQPQIQNIKEKYKNDPQKLNRAQMALFKEKGVNPMGGCLPLLLQMPILISFFTVFRSTIEFRGAPFFGWITDLSSPDTITTIAGFPINILPFLMGITMFLQQKLMASPDGGNQQKMMMYFMNVFFLFLFYTFPSGLNLYYSVFNILSIVQQKYLTPDAIVTTPPSAKLKNKK